MLSLLGLGVAAAGCVDPAIATPQHLPLPSDPYNPGSGSCSVNDCVRESARAPSPSYPPPFERCAPEIPWRLAGPHTPPVFSARLTREHRRREPHTCCYVAGTPCGPGRPLRGAGAGARVAARATRDDWC